MGSSRPSYAPASNPGRSNTDSEVYICCANCDTQLGIYDNRWIRLTSSYIVARRKGHYFATTFPGKDNVIPPRSERVLVEGCTVKEAHCRTCDKTVGQLCIAPGNPETERLIGFIFYRLSKTHLTYTTSTDPVEPIFEDHLDEGDSALGPRVTTSRHRERTSEVPIDPRLLQNTTKHTNGEAPPAETDDEMAYEEGEGDEMGSRDTRLILQKVTQQSLDIRRIATAVDRLQVQMQIVSRGLEDLKKGKQNSSTGNARMEKFGRENEQLKERLNSITSAFDSVFSDESNRPRNSVAQRSEPLESQEGARAPRRSAKGRKDTTTMGGVITANYPPRDRRPQGSQRLSSGFPRKAPWKDGIAPGPISQNTKRKSDDQQAGPSKRSSSLRNELRPDSEWQDGWDSPVQNGHSPNDDLQPGFVQGRTHQGEDQGQSSRNRSSEASISQTAGSPFPLDPRLADIASALATDNGGSSGIPLRDNHDTVQVPADLDPVEDAGVDLTEDAQGQGLQQSSGQANREKAEALDTTIPGNSTSENQPQVINGQSSNGEADVTRRPDPVSNSTTTYISKSPSPRGLQQPPSPLSRSRATSTRIQSPEDPSAKPDLPLAEQSPRASPSSPDSRRSTRSKSGIFRPTPKSQDHARKPRYSLPPNMVKTDSTTLHLQQGQPSPPAVTPSPEIDDSIVVDVPRSLASANADKSVDSASQLQTINRPSSLRQQQTNNDKDVGRTTPTSIGFVAHETNKSSDHYPPRKGPSAPPPPSAKHSKPSIPPSSGPDQSRPVHLPAHLAPPSGLPMPRLLSSPSMHLTAQAALQSSRRNTRPTNDRRARQEQQPQQPQPQREQQEEQDSENHGLSLDLAQFQTPLKDRKGLAAAVVPVAVTIPPSPLRPAQASPAVRRNVHIADTNTNGVNHHQQQQQQQQQQQHGVIANSEAKSVLNGTVENLIVAAGAVKTKTGGDGDGEKARPSEKENRIQPPRPRPPPASGPLLQKAMPTTEELDRLVRETMEREESEGILGW